MSEERDRLKHLSSLLTELYRNCLNPDPTEKPPKKLADFLGIDLGVIYTSCNSWPEGSLIWRMGSDFKHPEERLQLRDLCRGIVRHMGKAAKPGAYVLQHDLSAAFKSDEYNPYLDLAKRHKIVDGAAFILETGDACTVLLIGRREPGGRFTEQDRASMELIAEPLQVAYEVLMQTLHVQSLQATTTTAMDVSPFATVILDHRGHLYQSNDLTRRLANEGKLFVREDGVFAADPVTNRKLQDGIHKATETSRTGVGAEHSWVVRVDREGLRPYVVIINSLLAHGVRKEPGALIFIHDDEHFRPAPHETLKELFGLTPGESAVANAIASGKSLEECAEAQGHSVATSRNFLKRIFSKTGATRQSELANLILRAPISHRRRRRMRSEKSAMK